MRKDKDKQVSDGRIFRLTFSALLLDECNGFQGILVGDASDIPVLFAAMDSWRARGFVAAMAIGQGQRVEGVQ